MHKINNDVDVEEFGLVKSSVSQDVVGTIHC